MVVDNANMKSVLEGFSTQCREALTLAQGIKVSGKINKIFVIGMGGSGIGANLLQTYMSESTISVHAIKDYDKMHLADEHSLVFAVSYSGNTEETLSSLTAAKNKGAKIIAITSGGKLADMVDTVVHVPNDLQPRNAVGYLFFPMIGILFNSGILKVKNEELNEVIRILGDTAYFNEKASELAKKIKDKIPLIYSSSQLEACAYRFKCEINENAKLPSFYHVFPELCHNELVGYQGMERSKFITLFLQSSFDHDRNKKRMKICKELFEHTVDVEEIKARGDSLLAQMFSLIHFGDWVSYYLALWKRVDPTPVHVIENLKQKLKE